ncbi:hypothetical protein [Mycolicibacterium stellerae]|uniref:hypothetical protein n=1 Tax=Mycolicibacterium stellerae TaxID=2358193 RepID=UPI000F0BD12B|nr:hypothetical protein [Mycolicibacterium stellerae]
MTRIITMPVRGAAKHHAASAERLREDLQAILGQLFELHVQGIETHAHFIGTRFVEFQRHLETIVQTAREASNAVADALRGMDGDSGRTPVITELPTRIPGLHPGERCTTAAANMMVHRIAMVHSTICRIGDQIDDADTSIGSLLEAIANTLGKEALLVSAESRSVNSAARSETPSTVEWIDPAAVSGGPR